MGGLNISQDEIDSLLGITTESSPSTPTPPPGMSDDTTIGAASSGPSPIETSSAPTAPPTLSSLTDTSEAREPSDIDLLSNIPLELSVELGKTRRTIKEILDFGLGSVIELDKIAGEPVELLANGELIATGEVVVIDENFGLRITEILSKKK